MMLFVPAGSVPKWSQLKPAEAIGLQASRPDLQLATLSQAGDFLNAIFS